ncbi:hypothetical protein M413DRAFT_247359 [Hebeloma cylindrosporum]|uniref:N-acetyltransferase domain-containing protein n=1 Tax=Hebeloma cylindrosporum TaxID=76867 RepID=A0A0C3C1S1_HEBCY|nr:hypothetical protein M413DRAFT_247359 [Hebeloma cylindrosporum h7]
MHNDQGAISLSGGDVSLMKLQALAMLRAGALAGEYYIATNPAGEQIGYTLWMPPGQEMFSTDEQRKLGFAEFMNRLPQEGKDYFATTYLARLPGFVTSKLGPTGKLDSWWLHMAMVRRDYQKKGVVRSLINLVCEKAAETGGTLACATTSHENVPVYRAIGFTHLGEIVMPSPWGEWPVHLFSLNARRTEA